MYNLEDTVKLYALIPQYVFTSSIVTIPQEQRGTRYQDSYTNTDGHVCQWAISEARHEEGKRKSARSKDKDAKKHELQNLKATARFVIH